MLRLLKTKQVCISKIFRATNVCAWLRQNPPRSSIPALSTAAIIWKRATAKSLAFKGYPNNHDTIFYYTGGSKDFAWNRPFMEYDMDDLDEKTAAKYCHQDSDGRRYTLGDLTNPNPNRPNLT